MSDCCNKVCIQAKKIFDACLKQFTDEQVEVILYDTNPSNPTLPLTFVSGRSNTIIGDIINLVVTPLTDRPQYGRVQGTVVIPLLITYTDANNVVGSGTGELDVPFDVILALPQASIIPYQIEASVSAVCPRGEFVNNSAAIVVKQEQYVFVVDACISIILKVVIDTQLIVCSYGYPTIPPCQDYDADICSGIFELPLFPS